VLFSHTPFPGEMSAVAIAASTSHSAEKRAWSTFAERMASALADVSDDSEDEGTACPTLSAVERPGSTIADDELDSASLPLKPAPRGTKQCFCLGEVLFMCGHYGWLTTNSEIEHPSASKNGGRVYIHSRDVAQGITLLEGDKVAFHLYVDDQGLGAEHCRLQGWGDDPYAAPTQASAPGMNRNAGVFVPGMNMAAKEFTPAGLHSSESPHMGWAQAPRAAPMHMPPVQSLNNFALNEVCWADFTDDSDSDGEVVAKIWAEAKIRVEGDDGDVESIGGESDLEEPPIPSWHGDLAAIPRCGATRKVKARRAKMRTSSRGSSSTSAPSDSNGSGQQSPPSPPPGLVASADSDRSGRQSPPPPPPPGLRHPSFRPPPGLSLP